MVNENSKILIIEDDPSTKARDKFIQVFKFHPREVAYGLG